MTDLVAGRWLLVGAGSGAWLWFLLVLSPPARRILLTDWTDFAGWGGGRREETVALADLARIRASEFKAKLPQVILQELLSSTAKAAATYGAKEAGGGWGQLAGIVYQAATTSADTRCWRSLPSLIAVARIPTPADGQLRFSTDREIGRVDVAAGSDTIVLVSLPARSTPTAAIQVILLSPASN